MNTHVGQTQEKKNQLEADSLSQKQKGSRPVSRFMENRPEAVAIKTLQKMENGSPRVRQLKAFQDRADNRVGMGNGEQPVVQRVINVDETDYTSDDQMVFEERYDENHRREMLSAVSDFEQAPRTVGAALADPRRFILIRVDDSEYGLSYYVDYEQVGALVKEVEGGLTRNAGEHPEFVRRPEEGFEQIDISGLIMCVGIVIEAFTDDGVTAAVGAHFVTPTAINEGELSESGEQQLKTMLNLVGGYGELRAILCYAPDQNGGPSPDTVIALQQIGSYLTSREVSGIQERETGSSLIYRLSSNGVGDLW